MLSIQILTAICVVSAIVSLVSALFLRTRGNTVNENIKAQLDVLAKQMRQARPDSRGPRRPR